MPTDNAILADFRPLTTDEQRALAQYEGTIERGLGTFLEVGRSLAAIQRERLYRMDGTFETYCRQRWDISRQHGHRLIDAAKVTALLPPAAPQPNAESQVRPLVGLPEGEVPVVWAEAVEWSKGKTPTASTVKSVLKRRATPTPTVDLHAEPSPASPPTGPLVNDKKWPKFPGFSLYRENGQPFIQCLPLSKGDAAFTDLNRAVAVMLHLGFFDKPRTREEARAELHRLFDASWTPDPRLWTALGNAACLKTITAPKPMRYQSASVAPVVAASTAPAGPWVERAWEPLIDDGFFNTPRRAPEILAAFQAKFPGVDWTLAEVRKCLKGRSAPSRKLARTDKGWIRRAALKKAA